MDKKISDLESVSILRGEEVVPIAFNKKNYKVRIADILSNTIDSDKISAMALVEQANDIDSLKSIVMQLIRGELYMDKTLTRGVYIDGAELVVKGDSTPIESPSFVGQFYIDQASKIAYISVGNESVSDWKPINKIN